MGFGTASISSPRINQLSIQSSSLGLPITLGWGTGRVRCNLIWYNKFQAIAQTKKTGGKGGGVKQTTYTYTASVIMGLSLGEVLSVPTIYRNKEVFKDNEISTSWDGEYYETTTQTALQQAGLNLATGSTTQMPWGYLTSNYPDQALAYRDIAYVYAQNYALDDNAAIPNHSFEVRFSTHVAGSADANPKDIVIDLLTNPNHGLPGWTSGLIGDLTTWSNYCLANNLLLSPVIDTARAARDLINEWCEITNSAAFWSEGVLKVGTYGDAAATGNGVTFTPNLTPIYALTEDDFIPLEDYTPVSLEIRNQADACNIVQVEFLDRANQYNVAIAPSQDLANISEYGRRKQDPVSWHAICDASVARLSSQLLLQRTLYRREVYKFKLPWNYILLDPMDYVSLTTTTDQLKLSNRLVQIVSIEEGDDDCLLFTAEGVNVGAGSSPLYNAYSGSAITVQTQMTPVPVSPPVIVKAPSSMTGLDPEVWLAVAGANANWGGCQVWISADGVDYEQVGVITSPAKVGVSTSVMPDVPSPDTTSVLGVNMSLSGQDLIGASATNANSGATLFVLDNEIMTYEDATLTGTNTYNLQNFQRGLYGTDTTSHASGGKFARLDDSVFKISYTGLNYGETMYIKLPSFNPFGNTVEDLSTTTAYSVSLLDSAQAVDWRTVADQKAITGLLTNENHTVAAASDGTGYTLVGAGGVFSVFYGTTDVTATSSFSVVGAATKNGLTITINSSGVYALSGSSWTSDTETFTLQAVYGGLAIQRDYSISKSKAGPSGSGASLLVLNCTAQTFTFDGSNTASPASQTITFNANIQNLSGTPTWTATGYNSSGGSLGSITLGGSGSTRTMGVTDFGSAAYAVITASLGGYSDTITVARLRDGATGPSGANSAIVYIYQRAASAPTLPSATTTYTFATGALTGLNNGWTQAIPVGTNPLYVSTASASSTGATDTIASNEWASAVILAQNGTNGTNGTNGLNSATVYVFQRTTTATPPSVPSATVTYTFSTGATSGLNNGWSQTMPTTGGAYRWMTLATALGTGTTDTIATGEWASVALLAQDGTTGAAATGITLTNEAVQLFAYADGTVPSYAAATGQMKVYSGSTDVTSSSTFSASPSTGVTGTINTAGAYSVTNMTTNTGTLTLTAVYGGVSYVRIFSVSKVLTGYQIVSSLPSTNLFDGRMVYLTANDGSNLKNKLYRYVVNPPTFTGWTVEVDGADIKAGSVTAAKMGVTELSAITANVGLLRTATSGARTEIEANQIRVYDSSNVRRVRLGVW